MSLRRSRRLFQDITTSGDPMDIGYQVLAYYWTAAETIGPTAIPAVWADFVATVGDWFTFTDGSQQLGGYTRQATPAVNDIITFQPIFLTAGTWKCRVLGLTANSRGITQPLLDGVAVGTQLDWYSGSLTFTVAQESTGIVVATAGMVTPAMKVVSKNGSSSNYYGDVTYVVYERTA